MIRVAICDPHAAVRAGLEAILRDTPGIVPVGTADRRGLRALLYRCDPDVVIVPDATACLAVRTRARVVVHDRFDAVVEAAFAGAVALVDREAAPSELIAAIRGERELPHITPRLQRRAAVHLGGTDRAILAMGLAGTPDRDIAKVVGLAPPQLAARKQAIVSGRIQRSIVDASAPWAPSMVDGPAILRAGPSDAGPSGRGAVHGGAAPRESVDPVSGAVRALDGPSELHAG